MKTISTTLIIFVLLSFVTKNENKEEKTGNPTAAEQAEKMWNCLKEAEKTGTREAKGKCLTLQEELFKELGDDQEAKMEFKRLQNECLQEIADNRYGTKFDTSKSAEEKTKEVCDCFTESKKTDDRKYLYHCMELQSRYSKTFGEDSTQIKNFNLTVMDCQ